MCSVMRKKTRVTLGKLSLSSSFGEKHTMTELQFHQTEDLTVEKIAPYVNFLLFLWLQPELFKVLACFSHDSNS